MGFVAFGCCAAAWLGSAIASPVTTASVQTREARNSAAYPVSFAIIYDGRLLGTPTLYLREGGKAAITVPGKGGYSLGVRLTRQELGGRMLARLELAVSREDRGRWRPVSTPVLMLPFGGKAQFALDRPGGGIPIFTLDAAMGDPDAVVVGRTPAPAPKIPDGVPH